ncbi:helix-turn-helix domain-containing protein [Microbacterium halotolerans]|uniref:helix-turn-helix domain-containing protein n=1 Tax=Microbacterium halotolerans TaxID=246613 RepID=UPI0013C2F2D5|nr:helix-turn-helix domain-containing protein [Microbacterium halotolerans]
MTTNEPPVVFTLQQVAEILQLSYDLVRDKVYAGAWPHVKFSERNRRMTQEQIERLIETVTHEPTDSALTSRSAAHQRTKSVQAMLRAIS